MSNKQRRHPVRLRAEETSDNRVLHVTERLANLDETLVRELTSRGQAHLAATRPMQVLKTGRDLARAITKMHHLLVLKERER